MPKPDLLIVGGSARAAAWCAVRAGMKVAALDRYNDLDLLAVADPCFKWDGSDRQVEEVVGDLGVPWMYVGPLENRPDLVDRCARLAPLRGNGGDVLRAVRDPVRVQRVLGEAGLPTLAVREERDPPPADGNWLLKPRGGCGGRGIAVWDQRAAGHPTLRESHYFQELVPGLRGRSFHVSSAFAATPDGVRLAGVFRHGNWSADDPHPAWSRPIYGPDRVARRYGYSHGVFWGEREEHLARALNLRGPCGIDATQGWRDGHRGFVVEVNPRFTASMDLCDLACGPFGNVDTRDAWPEVERARRIVVTDRPVHAGRMPVFGPHDDGWAADVPAPGTVIPAGGPVCTVFAECPRPTGYDRDGLARSEALRGLLDEREDQVRVMLAPV